jgi:hypothetical protein
MTKITLETTLPIPFEKWIEQSGRFAGKGENIISNNMPIKLTDANDNRHASIEVSYSKPLNSGFEGTVTYKQHYKTTEMYQERDKDFNPVGEPVERDILKERTMISYKMILTVLEIESLLDSTLAIIPDTVAGYFNREIIAIGLIALENVEVNKTFNLSKGEIIVK